MSGEHRRHSARVGGVGDQCVEVDPTVDDLCRDVGQFGVGVARQCADVVEGGGHVDVCVLDEHAFGLFDDDSTVERELELLITASGVGGGLGLQDRDAGEIGEIAAQQREQFGFEPRVHLVGAIDELPDGLVDEVLATLREALSNLVKHARASSVGIALIVTGDTVQLTVTDDGVGFEIDAVTSDWTDGDLCLGSHGLRNIRHRARSLGGHATISSIPAEGTTVDWTAPLSPRCRG